MHVFQRTPGMWVVSIIGMLVCVFLMIVSFIPPSQFLISNPAVYVGFLGVGSLVAIAVPFVIYHRRRPEWKEKAKRSDQR